MSEVEQLVERSRRALAAFSRGDFDAAAADIDPEIEWHAAFPLPDLPPGKRVFRGTDEVRDLWRTFTSAWESLELEIVEFVFAGSDRQLIRARFVGSGAGSGVKVDRTLFVAYRFRAGRLCYSRTWESEAEARADLALPDG